MQEFPSTDGCAAPTVEEGRHLVVKNTSTGENEGGLLQMFKDTETV